MIGLPSSPTKLHFAPANLTLFQRRNFLLILPVLILFYLAGSLRSNPPPTVYIARLHENGRLNKMVSHCSLPFYPQRSSTQAPFGQLIQGVSPAIPFRSTNMDQYALDDILTAKFEDYPFRVLYNNDPADFIFLPLYSVFHSNAWQCTEGIFAGQIEGQIERTTQTILAYINSFPESSHPRFILPIATVRNFQNDKLLTTESMKLLREKVIVVSIESAPLWQEEGMKYLIDLPYPTRWRLPALTAAHHNNLSNDHEHNKLNSTIDLYHNPRPSLLTFAGSMHHNSDVTKAAAWTGFPLRVALQTQIEEYMAQSVAVAGALLQPPLANIAFDNFDIQSVSGSSDLLSIVYEHMTESTFCLLPPGDTPSRRGFYDAILLGCIPVIFRNSYARLAPSDSDLDPLKFSILLNENKIISGRHNIIKQLLKIGKFEIRRKRAHMKKIARKIHYSMPEHDITLPISDLRKKENQDRAEYIMLKGVNSLYTEDAFGVLLKELATIKAGKWKARGSIVDLRL